MPKKKKYHRVLSVYCTVLFFCHPSRTLARIYRTLKMIIDDALMALIV